jgi:hypothetical protein
LEGVIHSVKTLRVSAKSNTGENTNKDHQNNSYKPEFGTPKAPSQAFIE